MKTSARQRCLSVATLALLAMAALPAAAQEEGQPEAQQAEPQPEASQPVRRLFVSDKLVLNVYSEPEQAGSESRPSKPAISSTSWSAARVSSAFDSRTGAKAGSAPTI